MWIAEVNRGAQPRADARVADLFLELGPATADTERAYCPACLDEHADTCPELTTTGMA